jgi:hypothetical protein
VSRPEGGRRWAYEVQSRTTASIETVWALVAEAERWREWSFLTRSLLLREGSPDRNGVGALRRFAVGRTGSEEEVVVFEPPAHLAYEARRGLPVRYYRGDIRLEPDGTGTRIRWSGLLDPKWPGTGPLALAYARSFVRRFSRQLVRHADLEP